MMKVHVWRLKSFRNFLYACFFFSSRRRHTRYWRDWSSDVCSSDLRAPFSRRCLPKAPAMSRPTEGFSVTMSRMGKSIREDSRMTAVRTGFSSRGKEVPDSLYGRSRGGVEDVVVVGIPDLYESTVRDDLAHPEGVLPGKYEAPVGAGEADGREQHQGRAPDARPQLREWEAVYLLPVVPDGFEVGVVAPLTVFRSEEHTSELQSRQYLVC